MAEEIVIGKLIIDTSDLESSMASSKKAIIELENEQKKLKKDTEGLSTANEEQLQTFIANETELKRIKAEYAANQKSVLELTKAQTGLDDALKANIKSQNDAIANTKALTEARKQIDATTTEGAKAIADINTKIDANNKFLNASNSELEKQKANVGNYPQVMGNVGAAFGGATQKVIGFVQGGRDVVSGLSDVNTLITNSTKSILGFGNATNRAAVNNAVLSETNTVAAASSVELGVGAQSASTGIGSMVKSSLAFIATPLGAILAAIAITLGLVINAFAKLDPVMDKIEQGMAAVSAVVDVLNGSLVDFVSGSKSFSEAFGDMGGAMSQAAKEAAALKEAQQDLADSQDIQEVKNNKASQQYDELILKSKNRTLTEKERIAFLNQAQAIEEANFKEREGLANKELVNALNAARIKGQLSKEDQARLKKDTVSFAKELLNRGKIQDAEVEAIIKAENSKIAIQSESTRRLEKTQNAEDKLAEDAAKAKEVRDAKAQAAAEKQRAAAIKDSQNRIDILKAQAAQSNLTTEQQIANAEKIFSLQNKLAQQSLKGSDLQKQLIANRQELSSTILKLTDDQIAKEGEAQKAAFGKQKELTLDQLNSEKQSAEDLAKAQILLLNKKLLSEKAFADEVVKINAIKNESIAIANENFEEAEKVRKETELVNLRALDEVQHQIRLQDITDRGSVENEMKQAILQENYGQELILLEQNLADKKISNDVYLASLSLANKKFASETAKNDKILADQRRSTNLKLAQDTIGALQNIFGESKALSVASALINTYQGITAELSTKAVTPYEIGLKVANVAFVAAAGFAAVKNILKTDKGSASIDSSSPSPQTTSGAGAFRNTAQTETIARVGDVPSQTAPVITPPVLILESLLEAQNNLQVKLTSS